MLALPVISKSFCFLGHCFYFCKHFQTKECSFLLALIYSHTVDLKQFWCYWWVVEAISIRNELIELRNWGIYERLSGGIDKAMMDIEGINKCKDLRRQVIPLPIRWPLNAIVCRRSPRHILYPSSLCQWGAMKASLYFLSVSGAWGNSSPIKGPTVHPTFHSPDIIMWCPFLLSFLKKHGNTKNRVLKGHLSLYYHSKTSTPFNLG